MPAFISNVPDTALRAYIDVVIISCNLVQLLLEDDVIYALVGKNEVDLRLVSRVSVNLLDDLQHGSEPGAASNLHCRSIHNSRNIVLLGDCL